MGLWTRLHAALLQAHADISAYVRVFARIVLVLSPCSVCYRCGRFSPRDVLAYAVSSINAVTLLFFDYFFKPLFDPFFKDQSDMRNFG